MASKPDSTGGATHGEEAAQVIAGVGGVRNSEETVLDLRWSGQPTEERRDATCSAGEKRRKDMVTAREGYPAPNKSRQLQITLYRKAKSKPEYRFWSLYGEVQRADVLMTAWWRVKANGGAAGVDGITIEEIAVDTQVEAAWLEALREELRGKAYRPAPVRRVQIPKASGGLQGVGHSHGERPRGANGSVSGADAYFRGGLPSVLVQVFGLDAVRIKRWKRSEKLCAWVRPKWSMPTWRDTLTRFRTVS